VKPRRNRAITSCERIAVLLQAATFAALPSVAVTYYDVTGRDIPAIHKAIAKAAPKDPETLHVLPATSSWTVGISVTSVTTGKNCRITGATLTFHASATMPRLLPDKDRPAPVTAAFATYAAKLEARQAAQLGFAYARMNEVEQAIRGSRCDKSEGAADAALARLQAAQRATFKPDEKSQPKLEELKE